jgi:hypothetical protein
MGNFDIYLINPAKVKKRKYINSGVLHIDTLEIQHEFNFVDYIRGGTDLEFMIAIDFTESNGDIYHPNSLHFQDIHSPNQYLRCISSIGEILQNYNQQNKYSVFGFGGIPSWIGKMSSCFPLNKNNENPYVDGIDGVMHVYREAVRSITLSGPTYFQGILTKAISIARGLSIPENYLILLILTDGDIHDHPATRSLIVEASTLPISIIIVGVGDEDFSNMKLLDSDFKLLTDHNGTKALRDIVQFVSFTEMNSLSELASQMLQEVPDQLLSFMSAVKKRPLIYSRTRTFSEDPMLPERKISLTYK